MCFCRYPRLRRGKRPEPPGCMTAARTKFRSTKWNGSGFEGPVILGVKAQKEFIRVAGMVNFDPKARARTGGLREEMKGASQEIAKNPARMRAAEREGNRSATSCARLSANAGARNRGNRWNIYMPQCFSMRPARR